MSGHSKSPWRAIRRGDTWSVWDGDITEGSPDGIKVCDVLVSRPGYVHPQDRADALLIAAAPELLESARASLLVHDSVAPCKATACPCRAVRAAIAKAEGGSNG